MNLTSIDKRIRSMKRDAKRAKLAYEKEREEYKRTKTKLDHAHQSHTIIQTVAQSLQQHAHSKLASIVSRCLATVYDNPYQFDISFERKRNRTEAILTLMRNGNRLDPEETSGGASDIASFALRLACIELARPQLRKLVIMDEPFKFVEEDKQDRVGELLKVLSKEMNIQFIMITHENELKIGKVVQL